MDPAKPSPDEPQSAPRDLFIDALRVIAVLIVVLGHWSVTTVEWGSDRIRGVNALSVIPAIRLTTWLVQVMPVLFFVGGFSNATVRARHPDSYLSYLRVRLARLMAPTVVFFAIWLMVGLVVDIVEPARPNVIVRAAEVAALPIWFLGIYIGVVGLAPVMLRLHRRFRLGVPVALAAGAVGVDVLRLAFDVSGVGALNYAFVWLFAHQLGFWYREGALHDRATAWSMAAVGLGGLVVLTLFAGYPVSMVGVPGQPRWNTDPPSFPLIPLTLWLVGLALVVRPKLQAWVSRGRVRLVASLNRRVLTMYLWHISALPLAVGVLYPLGFPRPEVGSQLWWLLRPAWVVVLAVALFLLVAVFSRFEFHPKRSLGPPGSPERLVGAGFAVFSLTVGVLVLGVTGFTDLAGSGRSLLGFGGNPLLGLLHLIIGGGLLWSALATRALALPATLVAGVLLGGAGSWALASPGSLDVLGWNGPTAVLHVVVGAAAAVAVTVAKVWGPGAASSKGSPEVST